MARPPLSPSLLLALLPLLALPSLCACATTSASSSSSASASPSSDDAAPRDAAPRDAEPPDAVLREIAREHCHELAKAVQLYALVHGDYPAHDEGLRALLDPPQGKPIFLLLPRDPWGREFGYRRPGIDDDDFDVYSLGPDGEAGTSDDVGSWEVLQRQLRDAPPTRPADPALEPGAVHL